MALKLLTALAALAVAGLFALIFFGGSLPFPASQSQGVTVLVRQPYQPRGQETPTVRVTVAPAESPAGAGFAIDLGAAHSFSELSARFARVAADNAEAGFDRLEPRATIEDTAGSLRARLLVGPFPTRAAAEMICAGLALPGGVQCKTVPMTGEVIARQ